MGFMRFMVKSKTSVKKQDLRFERKFILQKNCFKSLSYFLSNIQINLNEKYEQRSINSIYYDTNNFSLAFDTLNGLSKRKKVRIRY